MTFIVYTEYTDNRLEFSFEHDHLFVYLLNFDDSRTTKDTHWELIISWHGNYKGWWVDVENKGNRQVNWYETRILLKSDKPCR